MSVPRDIESLMDNHAQRFLFRITCTSIRVVILTHLTVPEVLASSLRIIVNIPVGPKGILADLDVMIRA
jgi:hypothetical protein